MRARHLAFEELEPVCLTVAWPLLQGEAKAVHTANRSVRRLAARRRSSGTAQLRARSSHHCQRQNSRRRFDTCHGFDVSTCSPHVQPIGIRQNWKFT